jgi:hypothetical protein
MEKGDEQYELAKREMYSKIQERRRKFIDKIGYENWDPFPVPFDPIDIRKGPDGRTIAEQVNQFLRERGSGAKLSAAYSRGVAEIAAGVTQRDDRFRGMFEFVLWYAESLRKEGKNLNIWDE